MTWRMRTRWTTTRRAWATRAAWLRVPRREGGLRLPLRDGGRPRGRTRREVSPFLGEAEDEEEEPREQRERELQRHARELDCAVRVRERRPHLAPALGARAA